MDIILLKDVKALGKKGEIVKVNDGYARNYILPQKVGIEANGKNMNDLKLQKKNEIKMAEDRLANAKVLGEKIDKSKVTIKIKANGERVFGSISAKEIAEEAKKQLGLDIDKKKLVLSESIKTIGEHEVAVKLHKDVTARLKVVVEAL